METDQKTPNAEGLRQLPYSELKKIAKKHGIKGNLKAEKIIATLTSEDCNDTESFSTPAQKTINSSRKNKEEKFNEDVMTPLVTPRRGTYSVGSPISLKVEDISSGSVAIDNSVLDMSNVTVGRGSERKLRPRKVSFMSPIMTPRTPRNSSIKLRPKTPVASRMSLGKMVSPPSVRQSRGDLHKSLRMTPQPQNSISEGDTSKTQNAADIPKSKATPLPQIIEDNTSSSELPEKNVGKSSSTKSVISKDKDETSDKIKQVATPRSLMFKDEMSGKKKRIATPNFKRIHEKAFEKMESIDDYHKRKLNSAKKISRFETKSKVTKAKSKIPAFSGIPFIPSVSTRAKSNNESKMSKSIAENKKTENDSENGFKRSKSKFDLKASLSRKLGYKPYTGPLKPLTESSVLNTSTAAYFHNPKEPVNKVVTANRSQNRVMLKGVRTNKRFELQMKNRKLE